MLLLRGGPQDMPYSTSLSQRMVFLYWFSGLVVLATTLRPEAFIASMTLSVALMAGYLYAVLALVGKSPRYAQTLAAYAGVGALFNVISWPLMALVAVTPENDGLMSLLSLLFLLLISWEVLVKAFIWRHALDSGMFHGLLLALALFFLTMILTQRLTDWLA